MRNAVKAGIVVGVIATFGCIVANYYVFAALLAVATVALVVGQRK